MAARNPTWMAPGGAASSRVCGIGGSPRSSKPQASTPIFVAEKLFDEFSIGRINAHSSSSPSVSSSTSEVSSRTDDALPKHGSDRISESAGIFRTSDAFKADSSQIGHRDAVFTAFGARRDEIGHKDADFIAFGSRRNEIGRKDSDSMAFGARRDGIATGARMGEAGRKNADFARFRGSEVTRKDGIGRSDERFTAFAPSDGSRTDVGFQPSAPPFECIGKTDFFGLEDIFGGVPGIRNKAEDDVFSMGAPPSAPVHQRSSSSPSVSRGAHESPRKSLDADAHPTQQYFHATGLSPKAAGATHDGPVLFGNHVNSASASHLRETPALHGSSRLRNSGSGTSDTKSTVPGDRPTPNNLAPPYVVKPSVSSSSVQSSAPPYIVRPSVSPSSSQYSSSGSLSPGKFAQPSIQKAHNSVSEPSIGKIAPGSLHNSTSQVAAGKLVPPPTQKLHNSEASSTGKGAPQKLPSEVPSVGKGVEEKISGQTKAKTAPDPPQKSKLSSEASSTASSASSGSEKGAPPMKNKVSKVSDATNAPQKIHNHETNKEKEKPVGEEVLLSKENGTWESKRQSDTVQDPSNSPRKSKRQSAKERLKAVLFPDFGSKKEDKAKWLTLGDVKLVTKPTDVPPPNRAPPELDLESKPSYKRNERWRRSSCEFPLGKDGRSVLKESATHLPQADGEDFAGLSSSASAMKRAVERAEAKHKHKQTGDEVPSKRDDEASSAKREAHKQAEMENGGHRHQVDMDKRAVERAAHELRETALKKAAERAAKISSENAESVARSTSAPKQRVSSDDAEREAKKMFFSGEQRKSVPFPPVKVDLKDEAKELRRMSSEKTLQERAARVLAEKNQRELSAQRELEERQRISAAVDLQIKAWAAGKEGNLRALLLGLQDALWPGSGWQALSESDLRDEGSIKKAYRKATLCVHPDKIQQRGASIREKLIAEKLFDLLQGAWNKFNSQEAFFWQVV